MTIKSTIEPLASTDIKKIGIIRANALGDFIVTLPAINALKNHFPEAELILLGNKWHKDFLEESDSNGDKRTPINRVIILPIIKGLREEKGHEENKEEKTLFYESMINENFDLIISFQGKGDASIPFIKKCKPRFSAALNSTDNLQADFCLKYYYYQSEVMRFLELVSTIGVPITTPIPTINIFQNDYDEAKKYLTKNHINNFITIHAGCNDRRRMWPKEKFAQLCSYLNQSEYSIILTGSDSEFNYNAEIIKLSKSKCYNAAGVLSLGAVAALYQLSKLLIAVDTGTLHLAIASGAKTVGLYWAPNVINWSPLYRKDHRPVISWQLVCPYCNIIPNSPYPFEPKDKCSHDYSFLENITIEEVINAVSGLL